MKKDNAEKGVKDKDEGKGKGKEKDTVKEEKPLPQVRTLLSLSLLFLRPLSHSLHRKRSLRAE